MNAQEKALHRARAAQWAHDLLREPFLVLDTETTGLDPRAQVVQVAVIDSDGQALLSQNVKPSVPIHPDAAWVHGLTAEALRGAPAFPEVHAALAELLRDRVVVAYNAEFDRRILAQTCQAYQLPVLTVRAWHCAMLHFAAFHGAWNLSRNAFAWQKLAVACDILDIPTEDAHSALGDCRLTLAVVQRMAALHEQKA